jgi:transcriptional regulator with XRE-family HTH domain
MRLVDIVASLNALKGSGAWKHIAQVSGVDYSTLVRIARGEIPNPGVITCERIAAAVAQVKTEPPKGRVEYVRG